MNCSRCVSANGDRDLYLSSSYKDTSPIKLGAHLYVLKGKALLNFTSLKTYLYIQSHWGQGFDIWLWGRQNSVYEPQMNLLVGSHGCLFNQYLSTNYNCPSAWYIWDVWLLCLSIFLDPWSTWMWAEVVSNSNSQSFLLKNRRAENHVDTKTCTWMLITICSWWFKLASSPGVLY